MADLPTADDIAKVRQWLAGFGDAATGVTAKLLAQFDADTERWKEFEWSKYIRGVGDCCPACDATDQEPHTANCWLAARIALGKGVGT